MTAKTSKRRTPRLALLAVLALAGLLAGGLVALSGASAAPSKPARQASKNISVTLREFTLKPSPKVGKAGRVTFRVRNSGRVKHEFVVLRTNKKASKLLKGNEASEAGNVGEIGNVPSGSTKSLTLTLKKGHYALICNLPGHYKAGQRADFNVR
jgi:uncharacterized cupredoxin-like copper-binding protein